MTTGVFRPVSKAATLSEFTKVVEECPVWTEADAKAALALLHAEGMIEVAGDEIRVSIVACFTVPRLFGHLCHK